MAEGDGPSAKTTGPGVYTRLDPADHEALQRLADENGRSIASELRQAVISYLKGKGLKR